MGTHTICCEHFQGLENNFRIRSHFPFYALSKFFRSYSKNEFRIFPKRIFNKIYIQEEIKKGGIATDPALLKKIANNDKAHNILRKLGWFKKEYETSLLDSFGN
ncbi:hypothetical protein LEP1GSC193_3286 [Leptospira alstonii serovar Pingchang str. 80-412]|uniref:Uncharacterized protein n=2 Tax=Leptospira alstonii TaxID=28452 RepID=M6CXY1_9LEPT|nr:hypothetical protein LEP1GSC194_3421 [Leptospira alstonii serovar Sichuan str. 79601]EQA80551.1 hypothetical protein LEP1GSC193_3286 [Leptospira alstonii serovar Pingchang str. 80-412]